MNAKIGIRTADSGVTVFTKPQLKALLANIPEIKLTAEQVKLNYDQWYGELTGGKVKKDQMIQLAAGMIYRNGLHKNTGGAYMLDGENSWGQVKTYLGIVDSKKVTITRYLIGIIKEIHEVNEKEEHNLIFRSAAKYQLDADFEAIPEPWAFWGAYLHPDIPLEVAQQVYDLQQEIIDAQKEAVEEQKKRS